MVSVECNIQSSSEECHSNGFFAKKEKRERERELLKVKGKIAKILSCTVYPNWIWKKSKLNWCSAF